MLPLLTPGYLMFFVIGPNSGQQRENGAIKIRQTWVSISLLSSFSAEVHTAKASYFHKINSTSDTRNLFKTFNSLLCPSLIPPHHHHLLNSRWLCHFLHKQNCQSVASSPLHTRMNSNQPRLLIKLPSSPSAPSWRPKYTNFSSPAILQHVL